MEPDICASCGVLAPPSENACASCDAKYSSPRPKALDQPGNGYWVAVKATFTCNACRFDSPLNHFELDEGVRCTRCGLEQRYDRKEWRKLVDFAHEVGDFGSGGPEGRFADPDVPLTEPNRFADLASSRGWAKQRHHKASPGNPLCRSCNAPVVSKGRQGDLLAVECSGCGERRQYEMPESAQRMKRLAGVLADEHEAGGREVVLQEKSGVVALHCPSCEAPLDNIREADGIIVCSYCDASCRISTQSHARAGHKETPSKTWWLYFDQPSAERNKRLNEAKQATARAEKKRKKAEQRARSQAAQPERKPAARRSPEERAKKAQRNALIPLLAVFLLAPIIWVFTVVKPFDEETGETSEPAALASEGPLKRFSFDMSTSKAAKLFGVSASQDMTVKLDPAGVIRKAQITRSKSGPMPRYHIGLWGGDAFDASGVVARFKKIAPTSLKQNGSNHEVNLNQSILRFDPRNQPPGYIQVSTWLKDDGSAKKVANAFWAAARYLAYGGPEPTHEQLDLLNGRSK